MTEESNAAITTESDTAPDSSAPAEPVRALDFSQPTKFTPDLRRRIVRALDPICEALTTRLSAELRATVELSLGDFSQLTWAAAKAQLPVDSIAVALEAQPIEKQMLLSVELPLVLQALECLLGGSAEQAPAERRLSEIDWALNRRLLESIVHQLSLAWRDLCGQELLLGEVDMEGDAGVIAPIGEPTFLVTFQSKIDGLSSAICLLVPWTAIAPVADEIVGGGGRPDEANPQEARAVQRGLVGAQIMLRAQIGSVRMPVEQMLGLSPGSVLTLEDRAEDGVQLFAEGISVGWGKPGRSGARRAVQVISTIEPPSRNKTQTQPTRAELEKTGAARREGMAGLRSIPVRVWAELGRTYIPLGETLELTPGSVVELGESADAPIELFVNGLCFARGDLVVTSEGEWAVQVNEIL
ncbi:MAG TPA: FliM/FliN family flagellar motor switch protein [Solirubrobacteraceae bacterium]|jgi:flagellar motor switch protein FliM